LKAERRRLRLYRPRKALELLPLYVIQASATNIDYVLANVFIATRLYSSANARAPARRAICHIVDIVGGMSLSVPPEIKGLFFDFLCSVQPGLCSIWLNLDLA
jgi:hypothetical protein